MKVTGLSAGIAGQYAAAKKLGIIPPMEVPIKYAHFAAIFLVILFCVFLAVWLTE